MLDHLVTTLDNFANQGHLSQTFKTFNLLQQHACSTSSEVLVHPVSSLLLLCTSQKLLPQGKQLHAHIFTLGLERHFILVPKLVSFYLSFNLLIDAHFITVSSNILHTLPWNLLISSYVKNGLYGKAISTYRQMVEKGSRPDNFTYPSVLKACAELLDIASGQEVHLSIDASGCDWCLYVHNALVSMYAKCEELDVARKLFDKMPEKDVVSWNTMIFGYASKGMLDEAFQLFDCTKVESVEVNIITWNTIAGGYLRTKNFIGVFELFIQMKTRGFQLDSVAVIIGLTACFHIGDIKLGKEIHSFSIRNHHDGVYTVKNALITMYSRCKYLTHAYNLFRFVEAKSIITWNSMISGCCHLNRAEEASFIFRGMLFSGVEPNYVTIASILPLCARVANLQHGKQFHCYILRHEEFKDYLLLWNALVDMYARSGKMLDAKKLFDSLKKKDEVTYTSLIYGYGSQEEGQAALKLFNEMNRFQLKPDHVTMTAILSACRHSRLVTEGQMLFEKMQSVYGIIPRLEHFECMVDLYCRSGRVYKAIELIKWMPYRKTPAIWATITRACHNHGL